MNWPAVLSLVTADSTEQPVVVTALGYDHAKVVANGSTFELPLAELSYYWYGDHLLLWRPGDAPARDLTPGVDDDGVRWLRETLATNNIAVSNLVLGRFYCFVAGNFERGLPLLDDGEASDGSL